MPASELAGERRRLHLDEMDDAALDLRDRLLGDDDDVEVREGDAFEDQRGEVVAFTQLGKPRTGKTLKPSKGHRGTPPSSGHQAEHSLGEASHASAPDISVRVAPP